MTNDLKCGFTISSDWVHLELLLQQGFNTHKKLATFYVQRGQEFRKVRAGLSGVTFFPRVKGQTVELCELTEYESNQLAQTLLEERRQQADAKASMKLEEAGDEG